MRQRLKHAIEFAVNEHVTKKGQRHGILPYSHHLEAVYREVLRWHDLLVKAGVSLEDADALEDAAWLHDYIEDIDGAKQKDLIERFGERVAYLVWLVTDEKPHPSATRKERHAVTWPKTASDPLGVFLKLADKIANASAGGSLISMYRKEYPAFKAVVYTPGQWEPMWAELETLLLIGDRDGVANQEAVL